MSRAAHKQLLQKTMQGKIDIYFQGDSITHRWGATDYPEWLEHWNQSFHGWNATNFAWGGDNTHHILWRMQNGELNKVRPKVVALQAGTNNLPWNGEASQETIDDVVNINDQLTGSDGKFLPGYSVDGLHLELPADDVWATELKAVFAEILGPPSNTNDAPAPTGIPVFLSFFYLVSTIQQYPSQDGYNSLVPAVVASCWQRSSNLWATQAGEAGAYDLRFDQTL